MVTYPTKVEGLNPAPVTGRVLFVEDPTKFTPRQFLKYIDEGFVPVVKYVSSSKLTFAFCSYTETSTYTLVAAGSTYTSSSLDTAYAASL
jgi:hypothetical protein